MTAALSRESVVEAAVALCEQKAWPGHSLRVLARELGVSAPALYDHFDGKDDLLRAVAGHGFDLLAETWAGYTYGPRDMLLECSRAYVQMAVQRPELFALMFNYRPGAVSGGDELELAAASGLFDTGVANIERAIREGAIEEDDPLELALSMWAATHGVATVLHLAPDLAVADGRDLWLVDRVVGGLLQSWAPERQPAPSVS